jgi:hypothetical protein
MAIYGPIKLIRNEQYSRVYTGVRNILMEVINDISTRVRIAGHWCTVHYKGQKHPCFSCGKEGHFSSKCPDKHIQQSATLPVISTVVPAGASEAGTSEAGTSGEVETRHVLNDLLLQVMDGLVSGVTLNQNPINDALVVVEHPASFASVLARDNDNALPTVLGVVQSSQDQDSSRSGLK